MSDALGATRMARFVVAVQSPELTVPDETDWRVAVIVESLPSHKLLQLFQSATATAHRLDETYGAGRCRRILASLVDEQQKDPA